MILTLKKAYKRRRRRRWFNGEQRKVIEIKSIVILVKVDEMQNTLKSVVATT